MKMPDITLAQIIAVVTWAISQAVAYGWLTSEKSQIVLSGSSTIIAAAWHFADAMLRASRNNVRAAAVASGKPDPASVVTPVK